MCSQGLGPIARMSAVIKVFLCCFHTSDPLPKQAAHHSQSLSADSTSFKDVSSLIIPDPPAEAPPDLPVSPTPEHELSVPVSFGPVSQPEDDPKDLNAVHEDPESKKPSKKKRRQSKGKLSERRKSESGPEIEGKHEPLPRDAKPRKSILKKR